MTDKEAMQMALEALEYQGPSEPLLRNKAITALRQALEQPADKPVAWMDSDWHYQLHKKGMVVAHKDKGDVLIGVPQPLYTRPQPKTERYFCERCGKRSFDGIHTCTPPADTMDDGITLTSVAHPVPYDLNPDALEEIEIDLPKPKREWVGLTDEEIATFDWNHAVVDAECVRAIEARLKDKNT